MEQLDDEDIAEVTRSMSRGDLKSEKKYNIAFKGSPPEYDYEWFLANKHKLKVTLEKIYFFVETFTLQKLKNYFNPPRHIPF